MCLVHNKLLKSSSFIDLLCSSASQSAFTLLLSEILLPVYMIVISLIIDLSIIALTSHAEP